MNHTILVVEDEKGIRETLSIFLKNQGYSVIEAENGKDALQKVNADVHLAIVDIMMPEMDGITFTVQARQMYDFPIIFLSAKSEDIDKINGLNVGGDDYVTKPFEVSVLMARVNSHIRRYEQIIRLKETTTNERKLVVRGLELNQDTKEVFVDGRQIQLTAKEYYILELLMSYPGKIFSAEEIYETVWKEDAISTQTIMVHIRKLREKIEVDPKNPDYIKVVYGIGYKIDRG
ncbi:response regulator transcription factor [Floccifex sp.]|uniref:response regulator transcription factor n=1 Tax=Floccifex sp. TaxID=2815810 RepID=UPI002A74EF3A|nr:response regulator transcription factor [Floccifex sp.]MDD7281084.1 response regulator transcription factor [Erysipelotrichaceae bacterium]MDY2958356.1 response regulator transcription factor [Floccifex sp.]